MSKGTFTKECSHTKKWRQVWENLMKLSPDDADKFDFDVYKPGACG